MIWFNQRFYDCDDEVLAGLQLHWTQHLMSLQSYLDAEVKRINGEIFQVTRQIEDVKRELDQRKRKQARHMGRGASGVEQSRSHEAVTGSSRGDRFHRVGFNERKSNRATADNATGKRGPKSGRRPNTRFARGGRTSAKLARPARQVSGS